MKPCRECKHEISEQAMACPNCGAPYPAREVWDGRGFEYKSPTRIGALPLIHVSFKYNDKYQPVPAKGIIAIGQFAFGVITIGQFGIGLVSVCQFTLAGFALAQFAIAWALIAQIGIAFAHGAGQVVLHLAELF